MEIPYIPRGHSHMSVDIKCLSIDPLFLYRSYTQWPGQWPPFLFSPHPLTPFFPLLYQILHENCKYFARFARILRNLTILWQFWQKICQFYLEIAFLHTEWPPFLGVHTKKGPHFFFPFFFFWCPHRMIPFFNEMLHWTPPIIIFVLR